MGASTEAMLREGVDQGMKQEKDEGIQISSEIRISIITFLYKLEITDMVLDLRNQLLTIVTYFHIIFAQGHCCWGYILKIKVYFENRQLLWTTGIHVITDQV